MRLVEGYHRVQNTEQASAAGSGLSEDAYIGMGYMNPALLSIFLVLCLLAILPFLLFGRHIKSPMVLGGSNSLVISAACHVTPLSPGETSYTAEPRRGDDEAPLLQGIGEANDMDRQQNQRGDRMEMCLICKPLYT